LVDVGKIANLRYYKIPFVILLSILVSTLGVNLAFAQEVLFDATFVYPPQNTPDSNYQTSRGSGVAMVGDYQGALRFYDDALSQDPNNVVATGNKAVVFYEMDRLDESLEWTEKTLSLDSQYPQALNNKGWFLAQNGNNEEALGLFEQAIEIEPNYVLAKKNKLALLIQTGDASPHPEIIYSDSGDADAQVESGEEIPYDVIRPIMMIGIFVGISFALYKVKQKRGKSILSAHKIIKDPFISLMRIRWGGSNITYLAVFDNDRILFIRPDKLKKQPENPTLDDLLNMDKQNFQIPYYEIKDANLQNSKLGINGARGGKLTINASKNYKFDILEHESFGKCDMVLVRFLQDKVTVKP
jgi:tetratricopeptide (TPR) repeat protein